ncbi:hypothetical protein ACWDCL_28180 [Streptomyces sp. NPDC001009]
MLDDELQVVEAADRFLMNVRLSKDRAESTTNSYAGAIAMFLRWCVTTGRDWHTAARDLSSFILWLKWQPGRSQGRTTVVPGKGGRRTAEVS